MLQETKLYFVFELIEQVEQSPLPLSMFSHSYIYFYSTY